MWIKHVEIANIRKLKAVQIAELPTGFARANIDLCERSRRCLKAGGERSNCGG